jgi:hypothetical protein
MRSRSKSSPNLSICDRILTCLSWCTAGWGAKPYGQKLPTALELQITPQSLIDFIEKMLKVFSIKTHQNEHPYPLLRVYLSPLFAAHEEGNFLPMNMTIPRITLRLLQLLSTPVTVKSQSKISTTF